MNAIEDSPFTAEWTRVARGIPRPAAILAISAHWYTDGTRISDSERPKTVHDMVGFPEALYRVQYPAEGSPALARMVREMVPDPVATDNGWGIDHGTWSLLVRMFPEADIPVVQLSVDRQAGAAAHMAIGRSLRALRDRGVLILGSGNIVHNLSLVQWDMGGGFPWAQEFDNGIRDRIIGQRWDEIADWRSIGDSARLAFPTPEHFFPLLYVLGASEPDDRLSIINEACVMGAISMTGYQFG